MEQILVQGLQVFGYHGVYEQEKEEGQTFLVNCVMDTSFASAIHSDDVGETVDYGTVCLFIKKYFEEKAYDLLEKVADELATSIMYAFPGIEKIQIQITKPNAPIPMEFKSVGVRVEKKWHKVALAIGSNMGDKEKYLTDAMETLIANPDIRNVIVSDYIETEPYGYVEQDKFLNGAVTLETLLSAEDLLIFLHEIEAKAERKREIHWGPRTLDLDILLYDDVCMHTKELTIPHIDMCNRMFVLEPLMQIAPGLVHPVRRRTIYDLYHILKEKENA
ncbi:MAG: 2-amino-4-hydroxy-6-hydroxymethyldihydropteridine diphosphokinase [Lachnospiraceae bacterium]|nr:2-amino-4-hydroxy-6-hydroxymethyldihydropteridine diphosphokinase [Lachnospiraceae bacterium]